MSEDMVARLLDRQRKRLVASILGAAENSAWWSKLSAGEQRAHREKVLVSVGVFYDLCRDVIKVRDEDSVRNEHALELIRQVHEGQSALARKLNGS